MNAAVRTRKGDEFGIRIEGAKLISGNLLKFRDKLSQMFGSIEAISIVPDDVFEHNYEKVCTFEDFIGTDLFEKEEK